MSWRSLVGSCEVFVSWGDYHIFPFVCLGGGIVSLWRLPSFCRGLVGRDSLLKLHLGESPLVWPISFPLSESSPSLSKHASGRLTAFFSCGCHFFLLVDIIRCLKEACVGKRWQIINQWLRAHTMQGLLSVTVCGSGQIILKIIRETDMVGLKSSCVGQICPGVVCGQA